MYNVFFSITLYKVHSRSGEIQVSHPLRCLVAIWSYVSVVVEPIYFSINKHLIELMHQNVLMVLKEPET